MGTTAARYEDQRPLGGDGDRVRLSTWAGFAMMCIGMFMAILDVQVVATSIPTIQSALNVAPDQISWVQTAYLVAEVIAIPLTGFLTRLLSMRWLFVLALLIFTAASIGCAASGSFAVLIGWRVIQGFSGGTLIPAVFSAVFLLFPFRLQGFATTIAGVLAVLAPTVGPIVGGWITQTFSWHWLFLVNVTPGIVSVIAAAILLPRTRGDWSEARRLDALSLGLMALGLAALEIGLKEAPQRGWSSTYVLTLGAVAVSSIAGFVVRSLRVKRPIVELATLADRNFAIGCLLSFVLGMGLFGSVYMLPVFLAAVRGHNALEIGEVMLVSGFAQLLAAPVAVALERRIDPRLLTALGFGLLTTGLAMSAFQTRDSDFAAMFWPQMVRGVAIMFCLLPPTRMALGRLSPARVPDASGLFNLMRNLGGAIGLALIDTVIYGRGPHHAKDIIARLQHGDTATATAVGIPLEMFTHRAAGPISPGLQMMLQPMIQKLATVEAINDAWAMIAILTLAAFVIVFFARRERPDAEPVIGAPVMS